jgi:DNA-binding NarL/FixJ family response regulator
VTTPGRSSRGRDVIAISRAHHLVLDTTSQRHPRLAQPTGESPPDHESVVAVASFEDEFSASGVEAAPPAAAPYRPGDGDGVLIVDDCALFRESLATVLTIEAVEIIGTAWDLPSLMRALGQFRVKLIVLNLATKGCHLLLRAARELGPALRVIVVGATEHNESDIVACAESGVAAYHMRSDTVDHLVVLIRTVAQGKSYWPPRVSAILLRRLSSLTHPWGSPGRDLVLTARETQILEMIELGRSNRDIADRLDIALHTVKSHVHNLFVKLGVSTRAEAAAFSRSLRSNRSPR